MASIYKRGKRYWGRAQRDGIEKRRPLGTTVKSEALKRLQKWVEELDSIEWGGKQRIAFRLAMEKFLTEHCATIKPGAAARYAVSAKAMFSHFEGLYLDEITRKKWREYVTARRSSGASPASINRDRACLSKMFSCAIQAELYEINPVRGFVREREPEGKMRFLSREEYTTLLETAPKDMRAIAIIAVNTGMRMGEILTLTPRQIDYERAEIAIDITKTDDPRAIPMPEIVAAQFRAQPKVLGQRYIFNLTKSRYPVQGVSQRFAALAKRAGMPEVTFHDLRHTFATWAIKGWHPWQSRPMRRERLQKWLGHKSPAMTQRYAHLETEDLHSEMTGQKQAQTQVVSDEKEMAE